jgi:hypothetical protein
VLRVDAQWAPEEGLIHNETPAIAATSASPAIMLNQVVMPRTRLFSENTPTMGVAAGEADMKRIANPLEPAKVPVPSGHREELPSVVADKHEVLVGAVSIQDGEPVSALASPVALTPTLSR